MSKVNGSRFAHDDLKRCSPFLLIRSSNHMEKGFQFFIQLNMGLVSRLLMSFMRCALVQFRRARSRNQSHVGRAPKYLKTHTAHCHGPVIRPEVCHGLLNQFGGAWRGADSLGLIESTTSHAVFFEMKVFSIGRGVTSRTQLQHAQGAHYLFHLKLNKRSAAVHSSRPCSKDAVHIMSLAFWSSRPLSSSCHVRSSSTVQLSSKGLHSPHNSMHTRSSLLHSSHVQLQSPHSRPIIRPAGVGMWQDKRESSKFIFNADPGDAVWLALGSATFTACHGPCAEAAMFNKRTSVVQ